MVSGIQCQAREHFDTQDQSGIKALTLSWATTLKAASRVAPTQPAKALNENIHTKNVSRAPAKRLLEPPATWTTLSAERVSEKDGTLICEGHTQAD